jgi:ribonuclease BN (tRNA processing enzyme)
MASMRSIPFAVSMLLLASCERSANVEGVNAPASAVIEARAGISAAELAAPTRIVMLGTGTPIPDAHRASASVAVIHKGRAYLFDMGAGAVRNATRARYRHDIPSLYPSQICCLFVTHMHSDHTLDYSELVYTLWWRRPGQLQAFGPPGMQEMTDGMHAMMAPDLRERISSSQPVANPEGYKVDVTELAAGFVFERDGLRIEAFEVDHGDIKPAFGYRIDTSDRSIVISGDTTISQRLLEMSRGVDVLIHEVISDSGLSKNSEEFQAYHKESHTTASELGRLASEARPGLLVLYHGLYYGVPEARIVEEVRSTYDGAVVLANDLDLY